MKTEKVNFDDLVGRRFGFRGVLGNTPKFKLGSMVFEAIEDPDDGYRSYFKQVVQIEDLAGFPSKALATVFVRKVDRPVRRGRDEPVINVDSGYALVDAKDGHVWLTFGTDYEDDYYPCFVFDYKPKGD